MTLQKDLAEVVRQIENLRHYLNARKEMSPKEAAKHAPLTDVEANCAAFISTHRAEIAQNAEAAKRVEMLEEALFQLSVRLDAPRKDDMDEGSWHTDMIARAQYLANQAKRADVLQYLAAAMYQAAGAYDMPIRFLDILSAAGNGEQITPEQVDALLPCYSPDAAKRPAALEQAMDEWLNEFCIAGINKRAEEIMRERSTPEKAE